MTDDTKRELKPRLRFPEFQNAGAWRKGTIAEVAKVLQGYGFPDKYQGLKVGDYPFYKVSDISNSIGLGRIFIDESANYINGDVLDELRAKPIPKGSTIFAKIGEAIRSNRRVITTRPCLIDNNAAGVKSITGKSTDLFVYFLMESIPLIDYAGGVVPAVSKTAIENISIAYPEIDEQDKIAECLSSLEELITANIRKLDALKAHKKGLMQKLFPSEGETQPRLRFPEFRNAPAWSSDVLGQIFETSSGGTPDRSKKEYWNGNIPWITTSLVGFNIITEADAFISEAGLRNSSAKVFPEKTILVAMYGQGKTRGQVAMLGIKAATNQACAGILPRKEFDPRFVFLNLGSRYEEMRRLSNSGGQENLSQGLIQGLQFSYPDDRDEQEKIAGCLTSLDELLAAQTQKLEALRAQKKGLMQQLFPSPEGVDA